MDGFGVEESAAQEGASGVIMLSYTCHLLDSFPSACTAGEDASQQGRQWPFMSRACQKAGSNTCFGCMHSRCTLVSVNAVCSRAGSNRHDKTPGLNKADISTGDCRMELQSEHTWWQTICSVFTQVWQLSLVESATTVCLGGRWQHMHIFLPDMCPAATAIKVGIVSCQNWDSNYRPETAFKEMCIFKQVCEWSHLSGLICWHVCADVAAWVLLKARCKTSVPVEHKLSMSVRHVHTTQVQSIPLWYCEKHSHSTQNCSHIQALM